MLHKITIAFFILVAATNAEPPNPVQSFDAFLKEATAATTTSNPTHFNKYAKQWAKHRFRINDLKMDVRKTDSLVTPIIGLVSFTLLTEMTHFFPTDRQAQAAEFEPNQDVFVITLRYGFQDGAWVLLDGTFRGPLSGPASIVANTTFVITDEKLRAEPYALPHAALLNWRRSNSR